jgi:hypothetical protein
MKFETTIFVRCSCGNIILSPHKKVWCNKCGKKEDIRRIMDRWLEEEEKRWKDKKE